MLYFRMVWTEDEYGTVKEIMQQCSEFSMGLVLQINETKNPELVQEIIAYPDQYYFTDTLQLYKRDPGGDIPVAINTIEAPPEVNVTVSNNKVTVQHEINAVSDDISHYETFIYDSTPAESGILQGLANPAIAPTLIQDTDGSIADGTYYVRYSFINNVGETLVSPAQSITISGGNGTASIIVTVPELPIGSKGIIVYVSSDNTNFYLAGDAESNTCTITVIPTDGVLPLGENSTAASLARIADVSKNWQIDIWIGKALKIIAGTGAGQERLIVGNTATEITVDFPFDTVPDLTSQYQIRSFIKKTGLQTSWDFPGLQPNTSYYVKVRAYDKSGRYTDSTEIQITTGASRPDIPNHKETHMINGDDYIAPADIGAETPAGAQAKVDSHVNAPDPHPQYALDADLALKVTNAGDTPSIQAGNDSNKPTAGIVGRLYLAIDTRILYRDNGTAWVKMAIVDWDDIDGKPSTFPPATHTHTPAEVGAVAKTGDTMSGNLDLAGNELQQAKIKDYSETVVTVTNSGAAYTIDLNAGNIYDVTLTANCTFTFSNPPTSGAGSLTLILRQDATGNRTVTWPSSVRWPGATAPTLSTAANAIDILTFFTINGGLDWFGVLAGGGLG